MDRVGDAVGSFNPGDLQKYTRGVSWPIRKDELAAIMKKNGAPDSLVSRVQGANVDQFQDQNQLMSETGL